MCSKASCSTQTSNTHVLQSSSLNKKHLINYVLQGPQPTHEIIYKTSAIGLCPIYQENRHVHVQWGLRPNIPIKTSK